MVFHAATVKQRLDECSRDAGRPCSWDRRNRAFMPVIPFATVMLAIGIVLLTIGDVAFKSWLGSRSDGMYALGFVTYAGALYCLVRSYESTNIAVASAILVVGNLFALAIVSWLFFREPLNAGQSVGMILAVAAIVVLERG